MHPKISIITPSYNQGRYIERTIQSVLNQGMDGVEYVVMDGGSSDETVSILQKYDSRLKWVSEKDRGQSHAVNKGISCTTGSIVGWLNSDDIYYGDCFRRVCQYFEANPKSDVVYGNANHITESDSIIDAYPTEDFDFDRLKYTCFICQPAVFFRRSTFENFGLLDERLHFCMDYEYWFRLALGNATFGRTEYVLAGSRLHAETKTLGSRDKVHVEINNMTYELLGRTPDRWILNYAQLRADKRLDRNKYPNLYVAYLIGQIWLASLRWNQQIPLEIKRQTFAWIRHYSKEYIRRILRK